jgi:hypothetical protein
VRGGAIPAAVALKGILPPRCAIVAGMEERVHAVSPWEGWGVALLAIFRKQAVEELAREAAHEGLVAAWPFIFAGLTLLARYLQGTPPVAYLIAAASVTFMAAAIGILAFSLVVYQYRPLNKLTVSAPFLGKRYETFGATPKMVALKYGLTLANISMFPMQYEIVPHRVSLGASINPHPHREPVGGVVPIGGTAVFWEAEIPTTSQMKSHLVEGEYHFEIKYGKIGRLNYMLGKKFRFYVQFSRVGDVANFEPRPATWITCLCKPPGAEA